MKNTFTTIGVLLVGFLAIVSFIVVGVVVDFGSVAYEETGPRASLKKYEWFVQAAHQIRAKEADLKSYSKRVKRLQSLKSPSALQQQELFQTEAEYEGMRQSYNSLVEEYNGASSKFNWGFARKDDLPQNFALYSGNN